MLADPNPLAPSNPLALGDAAGDPAPAAALVNADDRLGIAANGKPNYSIDAAAGRLTGGEPGWSSTLGQSFTVNYAFRSTAPSNMPTDTEGFQRFSSAQISLTEQVLQGWSDVADIRFVRVGLGASGEAAYSNNAAILFANYTSGSAGASAFSYFPGSTSSGSPAGDVWVNSTYSYNASPTVGNYGGQVLAHEIGHAVGLGHPSDYDADADSTFTYSADASYFEDSRQYTLMSYFSEVNTGGDYRSVYAAAPQLDDIAAAQLEYGANMTTRTGDTVYGFNSTADRPWFAAGSSASRLVFAVWDAGGADTFDFSGYSQNQVIDLRPGHFSSVGGLTGNVAIAQGAGIEAARGGSGGDQIHGNDFGDTINGNAGNDTIMAGDGVNYLRGDAGNDSIVGGGRFDDINGNQGDDTIAGGAGGDWLVGGQGNDLITSSGGDILYGNLGDDTLKGGAGAEIIRGGQGADLISGGAGADWLSGDRGDDTVSGGTGADVFHGFSGAGVDRIADFNPAEGDRVQLDPGTAYSVSQVGADVWIDMGGFDRMVLVGVQASGLAGSWIFVA